jgi:hypothetical protein
MRFILIVAGRKMHWESAIISPVPSGSTLPISSHTPPRNPVAGENFGKYNRFISEEYGRFAQKLKSTPEAAGEGSMLDNTLLLFGSATSTYHLSVNYPLILAGGKNMGVVHGKHLKYDEEKVPLSNLYLTMLHKLGVETKSFGGSTGILSEV